MPRLAHGECPDGVLPVDDALYLGAVLLEHELGDLAVEVVVLGKERVRAGDARGIGGLSGLARVLARPVVHEQRQLDGDGRAFLRLALDVDAAAHALDQHLCDGEPESRPRIRGSGAVLLLGERLEGVREELLAHARAVVLAGEAVAGDSSLAAELGEARADVAARPGELDRVREDVREDLLDVGRAADDAHVVDLRAHRVGEEVDAALDGLDLGDHAALVRKLVDVEALLGELDVAALELAHVEDVVDDREQVAGRLPDLMPTLGELGGVIGEVVGDLDHAADAVDGRADVVAHAAQELRLGGVCALRLELGLLQAAVLGLELPACAQIGAEVAHVAAERLEDALGRQGRRGEVWVADAHEAAEHVAGKDGERDERARPTGSEEGVFLGHGVADVLDVVDAERLVAADGGHDVRNLLDGELLDRLLQRLDALAHPLEAVA